MLDRRVPRGDGDAFLHALVGLRHAVPDARAWLEGLADPGAHGRPLPPDPARREVALAVLGLLAWLDRVDRLLEAALPEPPAPAPDPAAPDDPAPAPRALLR